MSRLITASALVVFAGASLIATSVIAPTFAQLIAQADRVIVADVADVLSRRVGDKIVTEVTFNIRRALKGETGSTTVLEFLGGAVDDEVLEIVGMPRFRVGDRDVLFINDKERAISPLVGFMYGRFRVTFDPATGTEYVSQFNFAPFTVQELGAPSSSIRQAPRRAILLSDFEADVTRAVGARAVR